VEPLFIERVFKDIDGASAWCDVRQSDTVETCDDMALASLDDALLAIRESYGGTLESLRWGDAHEAAHDHPVLGGTPLLSWFVTFVSRPRATTTRSCGADQRPRAEPVLERPCRRVSRRL
jgi:acyl-homoserine lactone acylase PvdQ